MIYTLSEPEPELSMPVPQYDSPQLSHGTRRETQLTVEQCTVEIGKHV